MTGSAVQLGMPSVGSARSEDTFKVYAKSSKVGGVDTDMNKSHNP